MDATNFNKQKEELEHLQKQNQNQTLRLLFEEMSKNYNMLHQAYLKEANSQFGSYDEYSNKGLRPQIPAMAKASHVFVKTDPRDNTLIVKDGYQWRKYGQKVTKNNPSPRAYFKCSVTPDCPVKKKVQRCMENGSFAMVAYEGQHNHDVYPTPGQSLFSTTTSFSTITLDLTRSGPNLGNNTTRNCLGNVIQDYSTSSDIDGDKRIKDYVASLTKDHSFTAALAAAVARSIITETD